MHLVLEFYKVSYAQGHNILRLFDVLQTFSFTTSEVKRGY